MTGALKDEEGRWVCPAGCWSENGPPNCIHLRRLDKAASLLAELMEDDEDDGLDELYDWLEE